MCQKDTTKILTARKDHKVWKVVRSGRRAHFVYCLWQGVELRTNIKLEAYGFDHGHGFYCFHSLAAARKYEHNLGTCWDREIRHATIPKHSMYCHGTQEHGSYGGGLPTTRASHIIVGQKGDTR